MTTLTAPSGGIKNAAGDLAAGTLTVWALEPRESKDGTALIDTRRHQITITAGTFSSVTLDPGPVNLTLATTGAAKTFRGVIVPDQASVSLDDLLAGAYTYVPAVQSAVAQAAASATASATSATTKAAEAATSATAAAGSATSAAGSASTATTKAAEAAASAASIAAGGPDASPTVKGGIKLAGDLAGTADAPLVPGLADKYVKPGTGIPKTDLDAAVQTSLGKADSALQAAPVTTVAGKTGAVTLAVADVAGAAPLASPGITGAPTVNGKAVVVADDARLSDARTPTAHNHTAAQVSDATTVGRSVLTATDAVAARSAIGAGTSNLALGTTGTTAAAGNDSRIVNAAPTASPTFTATSSSATLGPELATGAWSFAGACAASGNGGVWSGAGQMTMPVTLPSAGTYVLTYTRSGTAGKQTITLGNGTSGQYDYWQATSATVAPTNSGSVTLTIDGDASTNLTLTNISLKQITAMIPPVLAATAPGGGVMEIRALAGSNNAVGYQALAANTTGTSNSAVGYQALKANTTGTSNVAIGRDSLYTPRNITANATIIGSRNTAIGYQSGASDATDPSDLTALGHQASATNRGTSIGSGAQATAAGSIAIGIDSLGASAVSSTADLAVVGTSRTTLRAAKLSMSNASTQTTAPAAGGAAALPATPAGYVDVEINGVTRKIAYY